jgi:hypothetical protein
VQLTGGTLFGFEIQINDSDTAPNVRDSEYHWWGKIDGAWNKAHMFGTAELSNWAISETLPFPKIASAPVMDGEMDDVWKDVPVYSDNQYDTTAPTDVTLIGDWTDTRVFFRSAWDDNNQYFFFQVYDEVINSAGSDYNYDGIELYWDADNSKTLQAFDGIDDMQFRITYDDVDYTNLDGTAAWGDCRPGVEFGIIETDVGYNIEMFMPLENVQLTSETEFGWDIQLNDADETTRDSMRRWWANDNNEWHWAELFGTAILTSSTMDVKDKDVTVAGSYALAQNYPNPFNPTTNITYTVDSRSMVSLNVYDVLGQQVASLVNEVKAPGQYTVPFDGTNLTSGVYFYKLNADSKVEAKKMMLVK